MTTAPMERADEQIQRDVLEELKWDAFVPIEKLEITVSKGWVTLKGDVEWEYQRRTAERAVRRLAGAWPAPVESPISSQSVPGSPRNHRILSGALRRLSSAAPKRTRNGSTSTSSATKVILAGRVVAGAGRGREG
jgi:hypothetical protein